MLLSRRTRLLLRAVLSATVLAMAAAQSHAQKYPEKPIRMIAPISAGGGADTAARLLARTLSDTFQQQVIVDNRPGGGNILGTAIAAKASPDGHSILWVSSAHPINAAFSRNLPYDSLKDFEPVALFAKIPLILVVHQSLNAKSVTDLLALAKAHPGKYNYASSGIGSGSHLGLEMLKLLGKVDMVNVSYKGAAPSIAGLLAGEVQLAMLGPLSVKPHLASGKMRALAVTTSSRSSAFPNLPALRESVAGYDMTNWYGMLAPRATPKAIVETLNRAMNQAQSNKALSDAMTAEGAELVSTTPAQFGAYLKTEIDKYVMLSKQLNIRIE